MTDKHTTEFVDRATADGEETLQEAVIGALQSHDRYNHVNHMTDCTLAPQQDNHQKQRMAWMKRTPVRDSATRPMSISLITRLTGFIDHTTNNIYLGHMTDCTSHVSTTTGPEAVEEILDETPAIASVEEADLSTEELPEVEGCSSPTWLRLAKEVLSVT